MRNFLIVAVCLFMPPACLFTPPAVAKAHRTATTQTAPPATDHQKKTLTVRGGTLLNSDATPEEAKKIAEATNRQILEKQRKR